jgi:alpha-beta hydrolase superfamily lysophospholipase
MGVNPGSPTLVLATGLGATSFLWNPLARELVLRGYRALSHFAPITQPTQLADILAALRAA